MKIEKAHWKPDSTPTEFLKRDQDRRLFLEFAGDILLSSATEHASIAHAHQLSKSTTPPHFYAPWFLTSDRE